MVFLKRKMWFIRHWYEASCSQECVFLVSRHLPVYLQATPWLPLQPHLFLEWDPGEQAELLLWVQAPQGLKAGRQARLLRVCECGEGISLLQVWKHTSSARVTALPRCLLLMLFPTQFLKKGNHSTQSQNASLRLSAVAINSWCWDYKV